MSELGQDRRALLRHYERDAKVYDLNRRFFLFGRTAILDELSRRLRGDATPRTILEVGCGTGINLTYLSMLFPRAEVRGIDLSTDMLAIATERTRDNPRITLAHQTFDDEFPVEHYDLIHFSYVLSTIPNLQQSLDLAKARLSPTGHVSIVDFHSSRYQLFKRWIGHSIPIRTEFPDAELYARFATVSRQVRRAYLGVWNYFWFVGQNS